MIEVRPNATDWKLDYVIALFMLDNCEFCIDAGECFAVEKDGANETR